LDHGNQTLKAITMKIKLSVQPFDGIEDIDFDYCAQRIGRATWEVDELDLFDIGREISAGSSGDLGHLPQIFLRRLSGAIAKAEQESSGFCRVTCQNEPKVSQADGKTLRGDYGLVAIRHDTETLPSGKWIHTGITLKFNDGTEVFCPERTEVLWASGPCVTRHLNAIGFGGGGWADSTNWNVFDHLLSHGH
jgi:hypothetical protein